MSYDLQVINNKDLTQFYNGNETDEESLMNFLKLSVKHWRQNDRNYKIIRYNKEYLLDELIKSSGLFRSVILNDENKIIVFSPPKSLNSDAFISAYEKDVLNCRAEQYVEGTMINVFNDHGEWEIATRSTVGGKITFFRVDGNITTFRHMFLDACNYVNLDFDYLDKSLCYSFILQHPENRIVSPIVEKGIYLAKVYKIDKYNVTEIDKREQVRLIVANARNTEGRPLPLIKLPLEYTFKTFEELKEKYASMNTPYEDVGVMVYASNGDRTKFRNPNYEEIRLLRGNQPKLEYHYLSLRKTGKMEQYLKYFPEYKKKFLEFREKLHRFTKTLHQNYVSCYVKKEMPLKDFPSQYRSIMYNLHQFYLNELRESSQYVSNAVVIQFVNNLHPSQQMFLLNYNMRKQVIDIKTSETTEML
jgi:hypothetical protein